MNENKFSPRAEEALRLSQEAAGERGHGYVGTEHLLVGLLQDGRSMGVRIEGREMKIKYVPSKKGAAMLQGKTLED